MMNWTQGPGVVMAPGLFSDILFSMAQKVSVILGGSPVLSFVMKEEYRVGMENHEGSFATCYQPTEAGVSFLQDIYPFFPLNKHSLLQAS